jgi:serine racemase
MHGATVESVKAAKAKILGTLPNATPVMTSSTLNSRFGRNFFFKCENMQKTGSFKVRGALNAVLSLSAEQKKAGVCTHSSGNHGQAVAFAAQESGVACTVVVPDNTPQAKVDAIRGYGATVKLVEYTQRQATADKIVEDTGAFFIHPYNNDEVMSGQGTLALELLESLPELDAIIVPISGGGMTAGIAAYAKGVKPSLRVFAVEPKGKGLGESLATGTRQLTASLAPLDTIADAIRTKTTGDKPWEILNDLLEKDILEVTDEQIVEGLRFSLQRMKLVAEPAGACAVACVLSGGFEAALTAAEARGGPPAASVKNVALIVCGGNADLKGVASML